ncbi:hypothetical protein ARAM_001419 [Aspergillus rambellii]|uniref:Zn(2)-C6 fungal-type domain-containing protein n=1 Tax=Aspergillus rambellii TaxID=308745 RepID=A0A0F8USG2_9EURO|nr:hypothetical protein ARAM_001419 [Aspergillus rambellii]
MNGKIQTRTAPSSGEGSKRRKIVACKRCHSHKIKCSGDQPCAKCCTVGCADECSYPSPDPQVKVSASTENRRSKQQSASSANVTEPGPTRPADGAAPDESNTSVRNPLIGDRAWFHAYGPSAPPIFVGEAACTAFATRFRQFLTGSSATAHIARTQYVREENLAVANSGEIQWPGLPQARLLVQIALRQIGCIYHVLLRKSTLEKLEEIYRTKDFECTVNQCKFFALFAFGEAYSMRSEPSSGSRVPGTSYFARSLSLAQSLFSYYLNRRHSAYVLIGSALRLGLCIGLNHNIPESQLIDPVERQHRIRIWWTIYIFDRMWGSKMGFPAQILDDDIHLDMPSSILSTALYEEQFSDAEYLKANIKLARMVGETIAKLYSRRRYNETFLQRVQKLLKALKNWVDTLPEHLRLNVEEPEMNRKHITSLHLAFNQCVILTTRPTLLHLLKLNESDTPSARNPESISQPVLTLGEACIYAARHSHSLIVSKWINGSLPVFGYFHAQYLFSSSLILAMSSFVPIGSPTDLGAFETGLEVLSSMSENGNLAASEFYLNLEQVKHCLDRYGAERQRRANQPTQRNQTLTSTAVGLGTQNPATSASASQLRSYPGVPSSHAAANHSPAAVLGPVAGLNMNPVGEYSHSHPHPRSQQPGPEDGIAFRELAGGFTTAMAFMEPTMQDFLAQSDLDLGLMHPVDPFMTESENLYSTHGM